MPGEEAVLPFHTYLWKIASRCNINCSYCYIYNSQDSGWSKQPGFMSEQVARQSAKRILEHCRRHEKDDVCITFHGGEPLLGGVEHLRMLSAVVREELRDHGMKVTLGMQSNGLLFTPEIGDEMLKQGICVGISTDGPPAVNDLYRVDHKGRGTGQALEEKIKLILSPRYRPLFSGFLCVINLKSDPLEIARYLFSPDSPIACDWPAVDFMLPHNNHSSRPEGKENDVTIAPYGEWLVKVFDYWFHEARRGSIRIFNSLMLSLLGAPSDLEAVGLGPVDLIVIESNGEIEGVDTLKSTFDGAPGLGCNVFTHDFDSVAAHRNVTRRQKGLGGLCQTCRDCSLVNVCGGGYLPHRYSDQNGFDNPSVYCADLMLLIDHIAANVLEQVLEVLPREVPSIAVRG